MRKKIITVLLILNVHVVGQMQVINNDIADVNSRINMLENRFNSVLVFNWILNIFLLIYFLYTLAIDTGAWSIISKTFKKNKNEQ